MGHWSARVSGSLTLSFDRYVITLENRFESVSENHISFAGQRCSNINGFVCFALLSLPVITPWWVPIWYNIFHYYVVNGECQIIISCEGFIRLLHILYLHTSGHSRNPSDCHCRLSVITCPFTYFHFIIKLYTFIRLFYWECILIDLCFTVTYLLVKWLSKLVIFWNSIGHFIRVKQNWISVPLK